MSCREAAEGSNVGTCCRPKLTRFDAQTAFLLFFIRDGNMSIRGEISRVISA
jgi:hypothetical protein